MKLLFCFGKNIKTSQTITPSVSLQLTAPSEMEPYALLAEEGGISKRK